MTLWEKITGQKVIGDPVSTRFSLRKFLCFSAYPFAGIEGDLMAYGWTGCAVRPWQAFERPASGGSLIETIGPLHRDAHFMKLVNGYWVRAITVEQIFRQWGFDYDLILIDYPDLNRHIWDECRKYVHAARMIVLPEDDHNEEVRAWATLKHWKTSEVDEYLVLEA